MLWYSAKGIGWKGNNSASQLSSVRRSPNAFRVQHHATWLPLGGISPGVIRIAEVWAITILLIKEDFWLWGTLYFHGLWLYWVGFGSRKLRELTLLWTGFSKSALKHDPCNVYFFVSVERKKKGPLRVLDPQLALLKIYSQYMQYICCEISCRMSSLSSDGGHVWTRLD